MPCRQAVLLHVTEPAPASPQPPAPSPSPSPPCTCASGQPEEPLAGVGAVLDVKGVPLPRAPQPFLPGNRGTLWTVPAPSPLQLVAGPVICQVTPETPRAAASLPTGPAWGIAGRWWLPSPPALRAGSGGGVHFIFALGAPGRQWTLSLGHKRAAVDPPGAQAQAG